jgi:hypothetical protein
MRMKGRVTGPSTVEGGVPAKYPTGAANPKFA